MVNGNVTLKVIIYQIAEVHVLGGLQTFQL